MESRICQNFDHKLRELEKNTELKVEKAKDLEDERFRRIDEGHREHERRLDRIDNNSYRNYNENRTQRKTDEHNWDVKNQDG